MRRIYAFFLILPLFLAACGTTPEEKIRTLLTEDKPAEALKVAEKQLMKEPSAPLFNALAAEARLALCFETNCFEDPAALKKIATHFVLTTPEDGSNGADLNHIWALLDAQKVDETYVNQLLSLYDVLPAGTAHTHLQDKLFNIMGRQMNLLNGELAGSILKDLTERREKQDLTTHFMGLLSGFISGDISQINARLAGARSAEQTGLSPALIELLPTTILMQNIYEDERTGAEAFAKNFYEQLEQLELEVLATEPARKALSQGVADLIESPKFGEFVAGHYTLKAPPKFAPQAQGTLETPNVEAEQLAAAEGETPTAQPEKVDALATSVDVLKLYLKKQELLLLPEQTDLWKDFMPTALDYAARTNDGSILEGLDRSKIPASAVETYNAQLFEVAEQAITRQQDALPTLKQVIVPEEGSRPIERELARLLRLALDDAIKQKNTMRVMAYTEFKPEIARQNRQGIVTLVIEEINQAWAQDRFEDILTLTEFMVKGMEVEFNLDSLLLKNFDKYLTEISITSITQADTPEKLLKSQEDVQLDLGSKFTFLQDYFSTNPAVIDTQLKNLVVAAKGTYGPATTLYRVMHLFDEGQFPTADRNGYLITSIKNSLKKDETLNGAQTAAIGYKLHQTHPELPLIFVVNLALERLKGLEEARTLWAESPDSLRAAFDGLRPQFAALMHAIDEMEGGDHVLATEFFTRITKGEYLEQAKPYLEQIRADVIAVQGVYLTANPTAQQPVLMLALAPQRAALPNFTSGGTSPTVVNLTAEHLLGANVTGISALGTIEDVNPETFKRSWGKTLRLNRGALLDPNTKVIDLSPNTSAFANQFGHMSALSMRENKLVATLADGSSVEFAKVNDAPTRPIFPQGRFGITQQISAANSATDHILPVGAIMELKVNTQSPLQPQQNGKKLNIIYPVAGILRHPASTTPLRVEGFYDPVSTGTNLRYTYPLGAGGSQVEARLRCQIVGPYIRCGGHNRHWDRVRYSHIVSGRRAAGGPEEITAEDIEALPQAVPAVATPTLDETLPTSLDGELPEDVLDFPDLF